MKDVSQVRNLTKLGVWTDSVKVRLRKKADYETVAVPKPSLAIWDFLNIAKP